MKFFKTSAVTVYLASLLGIAGFALAACDSGPFEDGPLENAGESVDDAIDDVEDEIDELN